MWALNSITTIWLWITCGAKRIGCHAGLSQALKGQRSSFRRTWATTIKERQNDYAFRILDRGGQVIASRASSDIGAHISLAASVS